jgi:hypothetical protein
MEKNRNSNDTLFSLLRENITNSSLISVKKNTVSNLLNKTRIDEPSLNHVLKERIEKLESLLDFYSELHQQSRHHAKIETLSHISRSEFYDNYYFQNRPVILKNMLKNSEALKKWSPDYFGKKFCNAPLTVSLNRDNYVEYEKNFQQTVKNITMGEYLKLLSKNPRSNDFYIVAKNYFFDNPYYQSLRKDIVPPTEIIDSEYTGKGTMKLWFGPEGTITPLHHDKHSILFAQIYGNKHFKMIPSFEITKIYNEDRYYSPVNPENINKEKYPEFLNASVADVFLGPGDMLFIPAGWWHWVKSLNISMSVTFSNFYVKDHNTVWKCK